MYVNQGSALAIPSFSLRQEEAFIDEWRKCPSFVVLKSGFVRIVNWTIAPPEFRSFRVGTDPQTKRNSFIYCPKAMSNTQASKLLAESASLPGAIENVCYEWRDLPDISGGRPT